MAPDGFTVVLVQGPGRRTDDKVKSGGVCHAVLSFEQDRVRLLSERITVATAGGTPGYLIAGK